MRELKIEIRKLYIEGYNAKEISEKLDITHDSARKCINRKAGMVCAGFSANLESHIYKEKGKGKRIY